VGQLRVMAELTSFAGLLGVQSLNWPCGQNAGRSTSVPDAPTRGQGAEANAFICGASLLGGLYPSLAVRRSAYFGLSASGLRLVGFSSRSTGSDFGSTFNSARSASSGSRPRRETRSVGPSIGSALRGRRLISDS
jgi:hypothetical protein